MHDLALLLDIGTTTISGAILNRASKRILASDSILNGQIKFGDDVIARIDFALKNPANAQKLQKAVVSSINNLIISLLSSEPTIKSDRIKEVFCVGNTAMNHLMLGIDATPLITPPYKPKQRSGVSIYSDKIGLMLKKNCLVTLLPNIGGFVGSDALAVIIASGIYKSKDIKLVIDIGTNGEVILGNRERIFIASTAAGPAFEGGHISCGMPAIKGAIESMKTTGKGIKFKVVGNTMPKGICGSGLIDAIYHMYKSGIMDRSGRMDSPEFILYKKRGHKVSITQQDVRKIQLAKAAIYAAISILMRRLDIMPQDIKEAVITGSFGNRLDPESILGIGLLPHIDKDIIRFVRNGPLKGLATYINSTNLQKEISSILSITRQIPLFSRQFTETFSSSIYL